ncbi:MAG: DUF2135 domain-containing protein [Magnetococcales bacterium]|nr:DUF2135 domain-containing protein [Magnetococcales bacterium]
MKRMTSWLMLLLVLIPGSVRGAAFDCGKASTEVEKRICATPDLSLADEELTALYQRMREILNQDDRERARLELGQRLWLQQSRDRCPDTACLREAYAWRAMALEQAYPRPITLEAPLGGWRNSSGEEVAYTQVVRYPASTVNTEEPTNEEDKRLQQTARIRGVIGRNPKTNSGSSAAAFPSPHTLIVNGVPMPLLMNGISTFDRPYFFGTGSNGVEIRSQDGSAVVRRQFYEAYNEKLRPRLRIVLSWDSNATDIDLHVITPKGEHCFYGHRVINSGGALDVDVTTGYGPEIFAHPAPMPGTYLVYVNYFGGGSYWQFGEKSVTVATISVVSEEGTPDEMLRTYTVPMRRPGELVPVARFVYP